MRRWPRETRVGDPPLKLQRYDAADWPNPECHPECAFWAAWEVWHELHPLDTDDPGHFDIVIDGPDVPWHPEWG